MNIIIIKIFEEVTFLGGFLFLILFGIMLFFLEEYDAFYKLITGFILIYLITAIIRVFYFKQRPEKRRYKNFLEKLDASSFPSIHAARITLLFLIVFEIFSQYSYIIIASFILWLLVLSSRIYLKKHDLWDVIGGVILGGALFFILF
jgi:membrane-associated phospholipid phosphatase